MGRNGVRCLWLAALAIAPGVFVVNPTVTAQAPASSQVTFSRDVLPILQKHCQSCHRPGQIGPMPLLDYQQARPWARSIKSKAVSREMPPWDADPAHGTFTNDRSLSPREIETLSAWADAGAPLGDPKDAPAPITWPAGGWLVEPEVVVELPAYNVPASGTIEWENIAIPSPFKTDTWVSSIEILPSDPSTVHHMCFEFKAHEPNVVYNQYEWAEVPRDTEGAAIRRGQRNPPATGDSAPESWVLTRDVGSSEVKRRAGRPTLAVGPDHCYVPGMSLHDYRPYEAGLLVRGGEDILVNLHYQPNGKPSVDRLKIGFTLAKQTPRKKLVQLVPNGATSEFAIPPNESNYRAPVVQVEVRKDAELVWMSPHMHFRGKNMTWTLTYPDGREQVVLSVPRYRYSWQLLYQTRVSVPAGTRFTFVAHFDNSAANRDNPNPHAWVRPGNQAWEEMMIPFTWLVVDTNVDDRDVTSPYSRGSGA
ncbi:MAG TPA: cytochrome c [Vicinamibacterales bacterium]|nr:cytochrome c [Vicinamibacterales bacterium]